MKKNDDGSLQTPNRVRVHDVIIKGSQRTKDSLIETEVAGALGLATTVQERHSAAIIANVRLERRVIFHSVSIMLEAGPVELHQTVNVVIDVAEKATCGVEVLGSYGGRRCHYTMGK